MEPQQPSLHQHHIIFQCKIKYKFLYYSIHLINLLTITFYFIYNVVKYLVSVDPKDLDRARGGVVNGLIGMFVMISVFGLMQLYLRFIGEGDISVDNGTIKIQTDNKIKFEGLE